MKRLQQPTYTLSSLQRPHLKKARHVSFIKKWITTFYLSSLFDSKVSEFKHVISIFFMCLGLSARLMKTLHVVQFLHSVRNEISDPVGIRVVIFTRTIVCLHREVREIPSLGGNSVVGPMLARMPPTPNPNPLWSRSSANVSFF